MPGDVSAHVLTVLRRAESLFAATSSLPPVTDHLHTAAAARPSLSSTDLHGAAVSGHRDLVERSAAQITAAASVDEQLAAALTAAAARHQHGRSRAGGLCAAAAAAPQRLAALSGTAAGELAALHALRAHLTGMQRVLAEQAGQDAAAAEQIRALGYGG